MVNQPMSILASNLVYFGLFKIELIGSEF